MKFGEMIGYYPGNIWLDVGGDLVKGKVKVMHREPDGCGRRRAAQHLLWQKREKENNKDGKNLNRVVLQ